MFPSPASQKGGVFVFERVDQEWQQIAELVPEEIAIGDRFGHAAALEGDLLAVSAPGTNKGCGIVLLFERDEQTLWRRQGRVENASCAMDERMGWSIDIENGVLYAGAPGTEDAAGAVHVFERDAGAWKRTRKITGNEPGDAFGESVVATQDGFVVGAPEADEGLGKVYVYKNQASPLELSPPEDGDRLFGLEIAIEGRRMLIGAPGIRARELGAGAPPAPGRVYLYEADAVGTWAESMTFQLMADGGQSRRMAYGYGAAVALNGDEAWIGAPYGGSGAGAVYLYLLDGEDAWQNTQVLSTRPLAVGAGFGAQLAVDGDLGVIGAIRADFGEGKGVVFERRGDTWRESMAINDAGRGLTALTGEEMRCTDGAIEQFACEGVDLLSFLPVSEVGGGRGVIVNDVWGWTDPETSREYAIVGRSDGTSFIDVTDPVLPVFVGDLPATEGASPNAWRDVKVYKNYALVVADNVGKHGMQIFDLESLRDLDEVPAKLEATAVYDEIYSAHNVVVNEASGFVYIVAASGGGETCGGGYHMVDMSDPLTPKFAGCFSDPSSGAGGNHIHDAQCVTYDGPDAEHRGKEICFGANASVFSIADVSDKGDPKTLAALDYPNVAYVHQGWLTEDQRYFYINDEGDEVGRLTERTRTLIWDVEDLDDPVFLKAHMGTTAASDHNFYIRGNLMYQSNYVSGLQILDISDPLNPHQVGHFDTVPWGENAPGFAGSWSNYPYFESGTVVVSSINEGLFLVRKQPQQMP